MECGVSSSASEYASSKRHANDAAAGLFNMKMMLTVTLAAIAFATPVSTAPVQQPDPDRWDRVVALRPNTSVRVTMFDGSRADGRVISARPDGLTVIDAGHATKVLLRDEVRMVERRRGFRATAIGSLIGAVVAIAVYRMPSWNSATPGVRLSHEVPVLFGITAIGAGSGLAVDAVRRRKLQVVYLAANVGGDSDSASIAGGIRRHVPGHREPAVVRDRLGRQPTRSDRSRPTTRQPPPLTPTTDRAAAERPLAASAGRRENEPPQLTGGGPAYEDKR
jgi:hypothetical protein